MTAPLDNPRDHLETEELSDPYARFARVWERARAADPAFHDAMCLATATPDGIPSARMVLLKGWDPRGFVFFTNLESRKGRQLEENPHAALCFHWSSLEEQVRVEGRVEPVTSEEADAYFASRPRGSQVGAWASEQSRPLPSRSALEERIAQFDQQFAGAPVPRPPHWSGRRLVPTRIEFWLGMPSRLHHRTIYRRDTGGWQAERQYP